MSAGHLSRQFKLAYGESPYSYLMTRRIERAMALLRRGDLSVTEVCFAVGCSSLGPSAPASPSWSGSRRAPIGTRRPARRRPAVMRRETGDQTDQEQGNGGTPRPLRVTAGSGCGVGGENVLQRGHVPRPCGGHECRQEPVPVGGTRRFAAVGGEVLSGAADQLASIAYVGDPNRPGDQTVGIVECFPKDVGGPLGGGSFSSSIEVANFRASARSARVPGRQLVRPRLGQPRSGVGFAASVGGLSASSCTAGWWQSSGRRWRRAPHCARRSATAARRRPGRCPRRRLRSNIR